MEEGFGATNVGTASLSLTSYGNRNAYNNARYNGTIATPLSVNLNDVLYNFYGQGINTNLGLSRATDISSAVDASPTTTRVPGRIVFSTTRTAGTNNSIVEAMRIDANGNVGINGIANASAALDVTSTTKGFLPPRMTATQMAAIVAPAEGLTIYCTDCTPKTLMSYNGTAWANMTGQTGPANTTAPVISSNIPVYPAGTSVTFTTTDGTWTGSPTSYTYQWQLNGTNISGATNSTLTTTVVANGVYACIVKAINAVSNTSISSNAITIYSTAPSVTTTPVITGYGNYVAITTDAVFSPSQNVNQYQWTADGSNIPGATGTNVFLDASYYGKVILCNVSNTNNIGTTSVATNSVTLVGIVNQMTGVTSAYAFRKISSTYSGNAINVRRSSDNTTQDIGFTTVGKLDTAALLTFVGAGNGFVTKWYDQSGNSNDADQTTAGRQPLIVNAGVVTKTSDGNPALFVNTQGHSLKLGSLTLSGISAFGYQTVIQPIGTHDATTAQFIFGTSGPTSATPTRYQAYINAVTTPGQYFGIAGRSSLITGSPAFSSSTPNIFGFNLTSTNTAINYANGNGGTSVSSFTSGFDTAELYILGLGNYNRAMIGYMGELIYVNTQVTDTDRKALEKNQGAYYGVTVAN